MKKLSVIVPIYNASKYLEQCITSIQEQYYKNLEIILINDGSTDNSLEICKIYEKNDSRIRVIDKKNEGVSASRNLGLKESLGEYITFVDSDDYIEKDMYIKLINKMEENSLDITICKYKKVNNSNEIISIEPDFKSSIYDTEEKRIEIIGSMIGFDPKNKGDEIMGSVCRCIFTRKSISNIYFDNILIGEDCIFMIKSIYNSNNIGIVNEELYCYRQNNNSCLNRYKNTNKLLKFTKELNRKKEYFCKDKNIYFLLKNRLDYTYVISCLSEIANECKRGSNKNLIQKIKSINYILNDRMLIEKYKTLDYLYMPFKNKILVKFMQMKFSIIIYIYYRISFSRFKEEV